MKKYADFDKLNRLLVASFEAEKLYYSASIDAKSTEEKRFLGYMAVERNRMSHDISNELHSRDIEPLLDDAEKETDDMPKFENGTTPYHCVARDRNNLKRYDELLERKALPESILLILNRQKQKIESYLLQAERFIK
jgi:hypothetical protein